MAYGDQSQMMGQGFGGGQDDQGGQDSQGGGQPVAMVCIAVLDDGSFEVYQGDPNDAGGGEPADSLDEALNMAADMLQQAAGAQDDQGGQGSQSGQGGDGDAPVADPQAVWNQLARKSDRSRGVS